MNIVNNLAIFVPKLLLLFFIGLAPTARQLLPGLSIFQYRDGKN